MRTDLSSNYLPSHQHDSLRALLEDLPESPGVLRIRCEIPNHPSFFPGGRGYRGPQFPKRPVMFIGHNFDTDRGFYKSVARGHEDAEKMPTWSNILDYFLPESDDFINGCFFTNLYLGAIVTPQSKPGEKTIGNTGTFKCSPEYGAACLISLKAQIAIVRPAVIALLGSVVPRKFRRVFPMFDNEKDQASGGQWLELLPDLKVQVVKLVHPANPRSTESHREQGRRLAAAVAAHESARSLVVS